MERKKPWVIPSNCDGCGSCDNTCKKGCLKMTKTNMGIYVPWIKEPEKCTGCSLCAKACAMGAISMTCYIKEAEERFRKKVL